MGGKVDCGVRRTPREGSEKETPRGASVRRDPFAETLKVLEDLSLSLHPLSDSVKIVSQSAGTHFWTWPSHQMVRGNTRLLGM